MSRLNSPAEWVAPLTPLLSLVILPLGPLFFPTTYAIVLLTYFAIFLYSQLMHSYQLYLTSCKIRKTIAKWNGVAAKSKDDDASPTESATSARMAMQQTRERTLATDRELTEMEELCHHAGAKPKFLHVFVIPNYCEPEGLLKDTINRLANHSIAKQHYGIILGMEASEAGNEEKGQRIRDNFVDRFAHFVVTSHPSGIPGESRGKGSNVCWAADRGCKELLANGVDARSIMLTIMDSDAAIPEIYLKEVEETLETVHDPHAVIMAPPIFFSRNCNEVPAAVRVTDITWSAMVMSNLSNGNGVCAPCSNYTLSLKLAERVGFWDTDADSVGEDMHMWLKCFFKTDGHARTAPIYVPINLTNVQCEGYLANIHARYVQARRHYNGVADLAYVFKRLYQATQKRSHSKGGLLDSSTSSSLWDMWRACSLVMEAHMIPCSSGWLMFAAVPLMQFILLPPFTSLRFVDPENNPMLTSDIFNHVWEILRFTTMLLPFPLFATLGVYEHLHRVIDRDMLHKPASQHRTWKNLLDYTMLPFSAWAFMTLPSSVSCVKRLFMADSEYIVASKVFKDDNEKSFQVTMAA